MHTHKRRPLPARVPAGGAGQSTRQVGRPLAEQECTSFFTFLGIAVGVFFPLWLLVKTEPPASLARWDERQQVAARTADGGGGDAPDSGRDGSDSGRGGGEPRQPLHARTAAAVEGAIRAVCGRSWLRSSEEEQLGAFELEGWQRALLWWQLLGLAWLGSMGIAGA